MCHFQMHDVNLKRLHLVPVFSYDILENINLAEQISGCPRLNVGEALTVMEDILESWG